MTWNWSTRTAATALLAPWLTACPPASSGDPEALDFRLHRVQLVADGGRAAVPAGLTGTVRGRAYDQHGAALPGVRFRWSTSDPEVAQLSREEGQPPGDSVDGAEAVVVTAHRLGFTVLTAEVATPRGRVQGTMRLEVPDNVVHVTADGESNLVLGDEVRLAVVATDSAGRRLPGPTELLAADARVLRVVEGRLRAAGVGTTEVRGRLVGSRRWSAPVLVSVRPARVRLSAAALALGLGEATDLALAAIGKDGEETTDVLVEPAWSASPPGKVSLAALPRMRVRVRALAGGAATVTASLSGVKDACSVVVSTPPPFFADGATFEASFVDPTHYTFVVSPAADLGTPAAGLSYELHGATDPGALFAGPPLLVVPGGAGPITGALEVAAPNPRWTFGVRAVDGEGQKSEGHALRLVGAPNPDLSRAALFVADVSLYALDLESTEISFLARVVEHGAPPAELAGARPGPGGAVVGFFAGADGAQRLFRKVGAKEAEPVGPPVVTDPGGCAGARTRPTVAFGALVGGAEVIIRAESTDPAQCEAAALIARFVPVGSDQLLSENVEAAAPAGPARVALLRKGALLLLDLATGQTTEVASDVAPGALLLAEEGTAWTLDPETGALTAYDLALSAEFPAVGAEVGTFPALLGARGGYGIGGGRLAIEDADGWLVLVAEGAVKPLLAPSAVGAVRLLLGAGP